MKNSTLVQSSTGMSLTGPGPTVRIQIISGCIDAMGECMMQRPVWIILFCLALTGCGGNPYLEQSLKPAELQGKDKTWFEKNWGAPSGRASRFFGGETWTYYRIAGGKSGLPFFNFSPNQCQITLKFDKEEKLADSSYSGC
jgi:hypothetical protein